MDRYSQARLWTLTLGLFVCWGCSSGPNKVSPPTPRLRLATTTSTQDSGLLDELLPLFESQHNCRVDVIAVGSGAALKLGERGDVDVLIVHAPSAEDAFIQQGYGGRREEFMYNDFVLLGSPTDPAEIRNQTPVQALKRIATGEFPFISRGDDSGTHQRELLLLGTSQVEPNWNGYVESGQGMGATLIMADEKQAYVLSDQGTYLKMRDKIELVPLTDPTKTLRNPYSVIAINSKQPDFQAELADAFVSFLIAKETQKLIASYRVAGEQLFHPTQLNVAN